MKQLTEFRTRLVEIYQKIGFVVKPLLKFLLAFIAIMRLRKDFGFSPEISGIAIVLMLSVISSLVPFYVIYGILGVYLSLQLASVSAVMSITVILILIVLYCFFIRITAGYSAALIVMPILIGLKIPYVIPILFGLFASPLGIIPCCSGVFTYYFLNGLKTNLTSFEQLNGADDPFNLYANIMGGLLKNEAMISAMIVFSLVIIAMYMVRNIRMDYSFEIAVAVGTIVNLFVYIILMLQIEVGVSLSSLLFFSILSGLIVLLINSMYRPLYYAGTERVQFEDDDYYYYVMAVPKIKASGSKVSEKLFITRRSSDSEFDNEEDDDDDFLEDDK